MRVVIVGSGKLGTKLAETMILEDMDVTIIEKEINVIDRINEHLDVLTVHGSGLDISVLKEVEIKEKDLLVASTEKDETNTLICSLAKKLGCKKTIARIRDPEHLEQMDIIKSELGIDHVINPDLATAKSIEKYLLKSHSFHSDGFASEKVQMIDFNIELMEDFVGKKLMDLREFDNLLITAISRKGELIIPNGQTKLQEYDVIYVIGKKDSIDSLVRNLDKSALGKKVEKIMILGGSNISFYLAKNLSKHNIEVTIIEKDLDVCTRLSETLDHALIVHGDGTDMILLEDESLKEMDALVGLTGFDEANLLMGLMAKQMGVNKVVSKISKENYVKVMDRLDIDAAFNPIYITSSEILKIVRGGKILSVSLLLGGEAEVTEILLTEGVPVLGKSLEKLNLPGGIVIGAIVRDEEVIIPYGETILKAYDRLIVFSLAKDLDALKIFLKSERKGLFKWAME